MWSHERSYRFQEGVFVLQCTYFFWFFSYAICSTGNIFIYWGMLMILQYGSTVLSILLRCLLFIHVLPCRHVVYYITSVHFPRSHARWRDCAPGVVRECGTVDMCRRSSAPEITPMTCVHTGERCHHLSVSQRDGDWTTICSHWVLLVGNDVTIVTVLLDYKCWTFTIGYPIIYDVTLIQPCLGVFFSNFSFPTVNETYLPPVWDILLYFAWHIHQIEGTSDLLVYHRKDTGKVE